MDIYSVTSHVDCQPVISCQRRKSQIRLMTASPITLCARVYPHRIKSRLSRLISRTLDFYKKTLFHTPFLIAWARSHHVLEYRDAQIVFEVDNWFSQLPQGVQRYILPLQSQYAKWYSGQRARPHSELLILLTLCKTKQTNLQRHHMQHHARWRAIWFCPIPGCPSSSKSKEGLVKHLMSKPHCARSGSEV